MRHLILLVCLYLCLPASVQADPIVQLDDRIAVCDDGTSDPGFSAYVDAYLLACQPARSFKFEEFGWSAPTAAGFLARLDTDVLPYKPTVVLTSFGMGDVAAKPLDDAGIDAYRKAQVGLVEGFKKNGARAIVVGSPRCVDSFNYHNDPAQAAAMNRNLATLADIDKQVAAQEGVVYADVFGATMAAMTKAKSLYGEKYVFETNRPESPAHLVVAYAFLKALGFAGDIGSLTVNDLATGNIQVGGEQWFSLANNTLTIESTLYPFWRCTWSDSSPTDDIRKCFPFDQDINRYVLTVKNLTCAHAKITWGIENHDFSAEQLAKGINLPAEFTETPFTGLFDLLTRLSYAQQMQERASGRSFRDHPADLSATVPWDSMSQTSLVDFVYVLKHAQRHVLSIQPLAEPEKQPPGPIPVILDTDLDGDVDDVGALALLDDFMDQGEADLIACVHNTADVNQSSCATIHAINAWYGHPDIPIGQYLGEPGPSTHMTSVLLPTPPDGYHGPANTCPSSYTLKIHQRFDPDFPSDDKMPAGVDVYRKALAAAADDSVVICSVGLMQNIQDLIQSQPDSVSPLSGMDLIKKKVRQLVIMSNTQPQDHYLLGKWPTKIIWTTYVGSNIGTGPSLLATPENNPVRAAYDYFGVLHSGRQSWDLTAAWLAVRGPGDVFDLVPGRPGYINDITHSPQVNYPNECEATVKMPYPEVSKLIGAELARPPKP
jgi:lysophospholipase L1-like esterase